MVHSFIFYRFCLIVCEGVRICFSCDLLPFAFITRSTLISLPQHKTEQRKMKKKNEITYAYVDIDIFFKQYHRHHQYRENDCILCLCINLWWDEEFLNGMLQALKHTEKKYKYKRTKNERSKWTHTKLFRLPLNILQNIYENEKWVSYYVRK